MSPIGPALSFDGSSCLAIPNTHANYGGDMPSGLTMMAYFRTTATLTGNHHVMGLWDDGGSASVRRSYRMMMTSSNLRFISFTPNNQYSARTIFLSGHSTLQDGDWHCAVMRVVIDPGVSFSTVAIYIDGSLINSSSASFSAAGTSNNDTAGSFNFMGVANTSTDSYSSEGLPGDLALSAVWKRSLSDSECRAVSTNPLSIFQPARSRLRDIALFSGGEETIVVPHWAHRQPLLGAVA